MNKDGWIDAAKELPDDDVCVLIALDRYAQAEDRAKKRARVPRKRSAGE